MNNYYIYILRCSDETLYTGITTDIMRRIEEHKRKSKLGAKYTHSHNVLKLEICFETTSRSLASKLEYHIKKLRKYEKESIITNKNLDILNKKVNANDYKIIDKM